MVQQKVELIEKSLFVCLSVSLSLCFFSSVHIGFMPDAKHKYINLEINIHILIS